MSDLDAIRAQVTDHDRLHDAGECDCAHHQSDRDLLAEVDWLQRLYAAGLNETLEAKARADILADAMVDRNIDRWDRGVEHERARALPVIEAARAACDHLNEHGCDTGVPLRTALAEYDR